MKRKRTAGVEDAPLELWRPPADAGHPIGCLATTYTFDPELFDQYCLGRFLAIDSDPEREDLPYLLERESMLAEVYAGVLVDTSNAGVKHSLRWDVLPVRVPGGIQHAKISLLVWANRVRTIVGSANLTAPGYRTNREVMAVVDFRPDDCDHGLLQEQLGLFAKIIALVPGVDASVTHTVRATEFLAGVRRLTSNWVASSKRGAIVRSFLTTLPKVDGEEGRSSLDEAVALMKRGRRALHTVRVASPFFDKRDATPVISTLYKALNRSGERRVEFVVPALVAESVGAPVRLLAPRAILEEAARLSIDLTVSTLPGADEDRNTRSWHAKMLQFSNDDQIGLMMGSSNFTSAGMGTGGRANVEANLLFLAAAGNRAAQTGFEAVWDGTVQVTHPEQAEWLGPMETDDELPADAVPLPTGFVTAVLMGGAPQVLVLTVNSEHLPSGWRVFAESTTGEVPLAGPELLGSNMGLQDLKVPWEEEYPPLQLMARWGEKYSAIWPLNVHNPAQLPPPREFTALSADEMLRLLAASDPGAALRAFARRKGSVDGFDADLDDAAPIDLDPLRRYDLGQTFLHTVRRRARLFARYRANLEGPVWGKQALISRLDGLLSVNALVSRFVKELSTPGEEPDRKLLVLGDLLLVLSDVKYREEPGALTVKEFNAEFRPAVQRIVRELNEQLLSNQAVYSSDTLAFWRAVTERCTA